MSYSFSVPYGNYDYRNMYTPTYNTVPNSVSYPMGTPVYQQNIPQGETFASAMSGAPLMIAIEGRHVIAHPFQSFQAAKDAKTTYDALVKAKTLKNLSTAQLGDVYSTLYRSNRYTNAVLKEGLRSARQTKDLKSFISATRKSYEAAVKAGNTAKAAEEAAKLTHIMENGRKSILPWRKVASSTDLIKGAKAAGKEAASAAKAASTVSKGAKAAKTGAAAAKGTKTAAQALNAGKLAKGFKAGGGPLMFGIEMLCEAPEIYTAFSEGGVGEGVTQTVKSGVKAGASAAGWVGGAALGGKAGAAIGTAICPGIGTAIGGVIGGIIGGLGGSWLGSKTAKAVTGKSYLEKKAAQEQLQAQMQPQAVPNNPFIGNPSANNEEVDLSGLNFNIPNPYIGRFMAHKQAMAAQAQ